MGNSHPYIVHFPIALFITAVIAELVALWRKSPGWSHTSLITSVGAAGSAVLAVISGLIAESGLTLTSEAHQVIESHETFGYGVLACALAFAAIKVWLHLTGKRKLGETLIGIGLVGLLLLLLTAHEGGELVYEHGVGVESGPRETIQGQSAKP